MVSKLGGGLLSLETVYSYFSLPDAGGDKGTLHSYIPVYGEEIGTDVRSLLEVGVWAGHSLAMWETYLHDAMVVGLDITDSRVTFNVDVRIVDATNRQAVDDVLGDDKFDVIIDDGSHALADQLATFDILWPRLNDGGKYFVEDVAGGEALQTLRDRFTAQDLRVRVWDLRDVKSRWDDILVMVAK